jgi:chaperonin GroES
MHIEPLYDRVIIERSGDVKDVTAGGVIIPEMMREKPSEGTVLAVGQGKYEDGMLRPLFVSIGDRVMFGKYAGSEVTLDDGSEVLIMREEEILGIVRGRSVEATA